MVTNDPADTIQPMFAAVTIRAIGTPNAGGAAIASVIVMTIPGATTKDKGEPTNPVQPERTARGDSRTVSRARR